MTAGVELADIVAARERIAPHIQPLRITPSASHTWINAGSG